MWVGHQQCLPDLYWVPTVCARHHSMHMGLALRGQARPCPQRTDTPTERQTVTPEAKGQRAIGGWPGSMWVMGLVLDEPGCSEQASLRRPNYGERPKFRHLVE